MVRIYLDDNRSTPEGYIRAYTVGECMNLLGKHRGEVSVLSLDNDLGIPGLENEGRQVCKILAELYHMASMDLWPMGLVVIHSANSVARDYMRGVVTRYGPGYVEVSPTMFMRKAG